MGRTWIRRNGDGEIGRQTSIRLGFEILETHQLEIDSAIRLWIFDMGRSGRFFMGTHFVFSLPLRGGQ